MPSSSPYKAPVAVETDEDKLARKAREPVRTAIFGALFVLVLVGAALIGPSFGLVGGLAFAVIAGSALTGLYKLTSRTPKALSSANTAGGTTCPKCGSVQTDQDYTRGPEGGEVLRWTCYACDHQWLA
jgi:hypothetical protein